jgi:muramidase (phage lysozyme)
MANNFSERQIIQDWRKRNPGTAQGLLYAIAGPEGTLKEGKPAFNVNFGGSTFALPAKDHPSRVVTSGRYSSAAAGVGQFMPDTWNRVKNKLGLSDFNEESQKDALFWLARERLKPIGGLAALEKNGLTPEIVAKLAPEWASLPTLQGKSFYGQPVKTYDQVQQYFKQGLNAAGSTTTGASMSASSPNNQSQKQTPGLPAGLNQKFVFNIGNGEATAKKEEKETDPISKITETLMKGLIAQTIGEKNNPYDLSSLDLG